MVALFLSCIFQILNLNGHLQLECKQHNIAQGVALYYYLQIHINDIFYLNSASMWPYEVRLFSLIVSMMSSAVHSCAALSHGYPRSTVFSQHYAAVPQTLFSANPAVRKRSLLGLDHQCPVSFSTTVLAASVCCQE